MNKERFLAELTERLAGLPQDEITERIAFYSEAIDDRVDDGQTEEEAVEALGDIDAIVAQITSEIPLKALVREKAVNSRKLKGGEIALIVLGAPLWLPLLIAFAAILLSVYAVIWSLALCVWAVDLSLAATAVGCLAGIVVYITAGKPTGAAFSAGVAMVCAGLAVIMFFICVRFTKLMLRLTKSIIGKLKLMVFGKGRH